MLVLGFEGKVLGLESQVLGLVSCYLLYYAIMVCYNNVINTVA